MSLTYFSGPKALSRPIDRLIENRSVFTLSKSELNLFETFEPCHRVPLEFSEPLAVAMIQGKKVMHLPQASPFTFLPGESLVLPAGQKMLIDFPDAALQNPTRCLALAISSEEIYSVLDELNLRAPKAETGDRWQLRPEQFYLGNDNRIARTLGELVEVFTDDQPDSQPAKEPLAKLKLRELLVRVMQTQARLVLIEHCKHHASTHRLAFAAHYIKSHLHDSISIGDLSKKCCMSKPHFFRSFKTEFGLTPLEFIHAERIKLAEQLLSNPLRSLADVCFAAGFGSLNYFIKVFKHHTGLTPKHYQKRRSASPDEK
ncbi:MAG: AraC family transcriptional regulator [Rhizobacter sp.]|nr:AraC family transcriptional regulator [Chlorobiales bacterium]